MADADADNVKTALVLPGGGARGAFQVGVLKAIAEMIQDSGGEINHERTITVIYDD